MAAYVMEMLHLARQKGVVGGVGAVPAAVELALGGRVDGWQRCLGRSSGGN